MFSGECKDGSIFIQNLLGFKWLLDTVKRNCLCLNWIVSV